MIKTYVLDSSMLADPADGLLEQEAYINELPAGRMEKILRIRHQDARKQSLGAGLLLNKVLRVLAPGAQIMYGRYGKPLCSQIPFNLSHTKDAVILSIWDSSADKNFPREDADFLIGCDIEQIKPYKPGIARRFFTEAEYQRLEAVKDPKEQAELFCRYWTKKESVMKLTGLGMSLPMDLYDVRDRQAAADRIKVCAWQKKQLQERHTEAEYQQAAEILLNRKLFFKEYRYRDCCITVCSLLDCFAAQLSLFDIYR